MTRLSTILTRTVPLSAGKIGIYSDAARRFLRRDSMVRVTAGPPIEEER